MSKKSKTLDALAEWVGHLIGWVIGVWLAMILLGVAHSTDPRVPTVGFGTLSVLVAALSTVGIAAGIGTKRVGS